MTLIVQRDPGPSVEWQEVVSVNSRLVCVSDPRKPMLLMEIVADDLFVRVTDCDALDVPSAVAAKVSLAGETVMSDPVPVRTNDCGLPASESVSVSKPPRTPPAVGRKVTVRVH